MKLNDFLLEIGVVDDEVVFHLSQQKGNVEPEVDKHSPLGKGVIMFFLEQAYQQMMSIINQDEFADKFKCYVENLSDVKKEN